MRKKVKTQAWLENKMSKGACMISKGGRSKVSIPAIGLLVRFKILHDVLL